MKRHVAGAMSAFLLVGFVGSVVQASGKASAQSSNKIQKYIVNKPEFRFEIDVPEEEDDLIVGSALFRTLSKDQLPGKIRVDGEVEVAGKTKTISELANEVVVYGNVDLEDLRTAPTTKAEDYVECDEVEKNCVLNNVRLVVKDETHIDLRAKLRLIRDSKLELIEVTLKSNLDLSLPLDIAGLEANYLEPRCRARKPECEPSVELLLWNQ